jgi:hypothetical protein
MGGWVLVSGVEVHQESFFLAVVRATPLSEFWRSDNDTYCLACRLVESTVCLIYQFLIAEA